MEMEDGPTGHAEGDRRLGRDDATTLAVPGPDAGLLRSTGRCRRGVPKGAVVGRRLSPVTEPTDLARGLSASWTGPAIPRQHLVDPGAHRGSPRLEVVAERFMHPAFTAAMEYVRSTLAGGLGA